VSWPRSNPISGRRPNGPLNSSSGARLLGPCGSQCESSPKQSPRKLPMRPAGSAPACVPDTLTLEHGSGLGRWRWVVERTFAWLNQFRRRGCAKILDFGLAMHGDCYIKRIASARLAQAWANGLSLSMNSVGAQRQQGTL
jgi:hypothetical protein